MPTQTVPSWSPGDDFYGVNNYRDVRVSNISPAVITRDYRAAPVINNSVIPNYTTDRAAI